MTKEQKAIENLTDLLKQRNEKQVQITTYNLFENIETVLSMLKQNSAEIEQKNTELAEKNAEIEKFKQVLARNIARNVTSSMKESAKSKEDLEMLNAGWQIELEKKDKIIDLMAEIFYKKFKAELLLEYGFENEGQLKQYFKEIAERKSEE